MHVGGSENGFLLSLNGRKAGLVAGTKSSQSQLKPNKLGPAKDVQLRGLREECSRSTWTSTGSHPSHGPLGI